MQKKEKKNSTVISMRQMHKSKCFQNEFPFSANGKRQHHYIVCVRTFLINKSETTLVASDDRREKEATKSGAYCMFANWQMI